MTHRDAVDLLDRSLLHSFDAPAHWADLGCGSGTFSLALAEFLPPGSTIEAIDLNPGIAKQTTANQVTIAPRTADFTKPNPALQELDGTLIANAIHYVRDQPAFLLTLHSYLKPGAMLVLVEYDTDAPVPRWVPYPLSFNSASRLFTPPDWTTLQKHNTRPSAFGRSQLYVAITQKVLNPDSLRSA